LLIPARWTSSPRASSIPSLQGVVALHPACVGAPPATAWRRRDSRARAGGRSSTHRRAATATRSVPWATIWSLTGS
jgi:hypothetical protein